MKSELSRWVRERLGTVRLRTTTAAVLVVGIAMLVGGTTLVVTLRTSLRRDVEVAARLRAEDIVTALQGGAAPEDLALGGGDDSFAQILDDSGEVVASSPRVRGLGRVARIDPGDSLVISGPPGDEDDPFLVVSRSAAISGGTITVLVARTLDPVEESTTTVVRILVVGIPLLLLVVAVTTWGVVGRALKFVESIRSQVAEISGSELHRRVPDPPAKDEIARLAHTMNDMLTRLEDDQKRQRRFISDASHELRSPLATIRNQSEVALAHPERSKVEELASAVLAEDLRLEKLVDDLLILASSDEHRRRPTLHPVDLDDLVLEEVKRLRAGTGLRITSTEVSGARTLGDIAQLRRVTRNLADNAAQHARSAVSFSLREEGDWSVLSVDDDGPGIPPEDRETVFERFARLDLARDRDRGGAGLGLAIVRETILAHGGTIRVEAGPIGGARFEIRLPVGR